MLYPNQNLPHLVNDIKKKRFRKGTGGQNLKLKRLPRQDIFYPAANMVI
jgi:hypothetical protein